MKLLLTLLMSCFLISSLFAEKQILTGTLTDSETGKVLIGANIAVYQQGKFLTGASTDFDGKYTIDLKEVDEYTIEVSYIGYQTLKVENVFSKLDKTGGAEVILGKSLPSKKSPKIKPKKTSATHIMTCGYGMQPTGGIKVSGKLLKLVKVKDVVTPSSTDNHDSPRYIMGTTAANGIIEDEKTGDLLVGATVAFYKAGVLTTGAVTDQEGNYMLALDPGTYEVRTSYMGYEEISIKNVIVLAGKKTRLDVQMVPGVSLPEIQVIQFKVPIIENWCTSICGLRRRSDTAKKEEAKKVISTLSLNYYPNPTIKNLNVDLSHTAESLTVRSIDGKALIYLENLPQGITELDVSNFAAGTYILQVVSGGELLAKQFVVVGL